MPPTSDPWQDYRKRRNRLLWVALAGMAVFAASFPICSHLHSAKPAFAGLVLWLGSALLAWVPLSNFPCPKCGKPFIYNDTFRDCAARECVHCDHPKWS